MLLTLLHQAGLSALETAINKALEFDTASRTRLAALSGKALLVEFTLPPLTAAVIPSDNGMRLSAECINPDATLRGSLVAVAGVAISGSSESLAGTGVTVDGDLGLLEELFAIASDLDIDWEAALARVIGDVPAHGVGEAVRRSHAFNQQAFQRSVDSVGEVMQEEWQFTPSRNEFDAFSADTSRLRRQVERMRARVDALMMQRAGGKP